MTSQVMDGRPVAEKIHAAVKKRVDKYKAIGVQPSLHVVLCTHNPASLAYVKRKAIACEKVGIKASIHTPFGDRIEAHRSCFTEQQIQVRHPEQKLLETIKHLSDCSECHGILVQLPLPDVINVHRIYDAIDPDKDVDVFHPSNVGKLVQGRCSFESCTPGGIIKLVEAYGIEWKGKEVCIINRSDIVGKPLAAMLLHKDATVTVCHNETYSGTLNFQCYSADVVVVAVGKPSFLKADMISNESIVIDVGINRVDGKIVGDVDSDVVDHVAWLSPVPNGVGPMTVATLLENTIKAVDLRKPSLD